MQWWVKLKGVMRERFVAFMTHKNPFVIVIRQLLVPAILAGLSVYVAALYPSQTKSVKALSTEFILALFFVMWFVGIYERAKKRTADDQAFTGLKGNVAELVAQLKKFQAEKPGVVPDDTTSGQGAAPVESPPEVDVVVRHYAPDSDPAGLDESPPDVSESRMTTARKLAAAGYPEAALLQGGVAFEQAVRRFGGEFYSGTSSPKVMSLGALVRNIRRHVPTWGDELETLVKIRNEIAHGHGSHRLAFEDVTYVLNNYERAIAAFEDMFRPFANTGDFELR